MGKTRIRKEELQNQLFSIAEEMVELAEKYREISLKLKQLNMIFKAEREYSDYIQQKEIGMRRNEYNIISLKVASFLKKQGVPVKAKLIYQHLIEEQQFSISYSNFQSNYLQRMNKDSAINVERACRGFWQYRRNHKFN